MVALEWKEEGDLRPGQDPAWEEGLQTREKVNVEKLGQKEKDSHVSFLPIRQLLCGDCGLLCEEGRCQEGVGRGDRGAWVVKDRSSSSLQAETFWIELEKERAAKSRYMCIFHSTSLFWGFDRL